MFNRELADRAIKNIEAHPEEWEQGSWHWGTTMCFAGHVAMMAGAAWVSYSDDYVRTPEGDIAHVATFAARELGLGHYVVGDPAHDNYRAYRLFFSGNTLDSLKMKVEEYSEEG